MTLTQAVFLFTFFTASLMAVRWLDTQSSAYEMCAGQWISEVEAAKDNVLEREYMLTRLSSGLALLPDGRTCPALLPHHKKILETVLTQ